jgi:hypothetical protein
MTRTAQGQQNSEMQADLLPMSNGDIFDEAFDLYKRNFTLFAGIIALIQVPAELSMIIANYYFHLPDTLSFDDPTKNLANFSGAILVWLIILVFWSFLFLIQNAAITVAVSERYLGRDITLTGAYKRTLPYFWKLNSTWVMVATVLSIVLFMVFSFVSMIFGALMTSTIASTNNINPSYSSLMILSITMISLATMAAAFACIKVGLFITQIVIIEHKSGGDALTRNQQMVKGNIIKLLIFFMLLIILMLMLVIAFTGSIDMGLDFFVYNWIPVSRMNKDMIDEILSSMLLLFLQPFWMTALTLRYYDLRVRKEGFDLSLLEKQLTLANNGRN